MTARLERAAWSRATGREGTAPPPRILHVGLGAFARSHQAWYTWRADPAAQWGITGFTGRSPRVSTALTAQGGLFTLVERGPTGDRFEVVGSVREAIDGADLDAFTARAAHPDTAILTLTVSERGYRLAPDGRPDRSDAALAKDIQILREIVTADRIRFANLREGGPTTAPGRLVLGMEARRRAGSGALAVVPCDNLAANGDMLRAALLEIAADIDHGLAEWIGEAVSFVSTSVDRITPATTPADTLAVRERTGWQDDAAVVAEPFADWVVSGHFPAGRPDWGSAGATFVADVGPFERRKLWLLNGAHSILAAAGPGRGHRTVAAAIADDEVRALIEEFWDEAEAVLVSADLDSAELDVPAYRARLIERFENSRIEHRLAQIADDATAKFRMRVVPVARATLEAGKIPTGSAAALATWLADDPAGAHTALADLDPQIADDDRFVAAFEDTLGASLASRRSERTPR